jgi:hypothetical protein
MDTSQFEAKKVALKQTKDGHVLTLAIHPDESPDEILRDFVGSRYMVVMVRLADNEEPLNREEYAGGQMVKLAGMLCRDKDFWEFLHSREDLFEKNEAACVDWLTGTLGVNSRSEIKTNNLAQTALKKVYGEYKEWKTTKST